mgnify:CR=1 FL=1
MKEDQRENPRAHNNSVMIRERQVFPFNMSGKVSILGVIINGFVPLVGSY